MENCRNGSDFCNSSDPQQNVSFQSSVMEFGDIFHAYNAFLYSIIVFGVSGNFIVLFMFMISRPKTTTDWFILFITTCDFCSSAFSVPVYVTFTNGLWYSYGTNFSCKVHMFLSQSIILSSSFAICVLALDRYIKICTQNSNVLTTVRARNLCIIISVGTIILSSPCFVMYENRNFQCIPISMGMTLFAYYLMVFLIFCTATGACILSYIKVTRTIRESAENVLRHSNNNGYNNYNDNADIQCCWVFKRSHKIVPSVVSTQGSSNSVPMHLNKWNAIGSNRRCDSQQLSNDQHLAVPEAHITNTNTDNSGERSNDVNLFSISFSPNGLQNRARIDTSVTRLTRFTHTRVNRASILTTKIAFSVCSVFIISWIPPWVTFFIASTVPSVRIMPKAVKVMMFARQTHLLNTVVNPILYTGLNRNFRKKLLSMFCCKKNTG